MESRKNDNLGESLKSETEVMPKIFFSKTNEENKYKKEEKKRIYLASPHMGNEEMKYIKEAFDSNWIAPLGPNVEAFEKEMAKYVNISGALALSSGTAAIHMAIKLLGIEPGDLVFCSTLTFVASCNPIIYERAIPVFIDSEPESFNMSPKALERAFQYCIEMKKMPKAVIVVHLYGQCADMNQICEICDRYHVPIIEDAAEALGAMYDNKYVGTIGEYGIFSFNGNKIITTSGGGMLVSSSKKALKKALFWSTQSRDKERYYQHSELGYNYRMSNIAAGIGRGQIRVLDQRIVEKKRIYELYRKELKDVKDILVEEVCHYGTSNYWMSTMTIGSKSRIKPIDVILALEKENIESRYIWKPIHLQPYYQSFKFFSHNDIGISVAEDIFQRGICLPSDTNMTEEDEKRVIRVIKNLFR